LRRKGEYYPIKENIFLESYEEVEMDQPEKLHANAFRSSVNQKQKDILDAVYKLQDHVFDNVLSVIDPLKGNEGIDGRFYSIWVTHMEEGFMALRKAISQPHGRLLADGRPAQTNFL
jgi:hypothetical protein